MIAGVVVVGLAVSGVGAYAVKQQLDLQAACGSVRTFIQQNGEVLKTSTGSPAVAILGDSYVMGDGLSDRAEGWAYHIGKTNGWETSADGISSTGYTNGGFCGEHTYAARLPRLLQTDPDTLIIQGGLNDWQTDPADIEQAAGIALAAADGVSRVVVIGPVNAPSRARTLPSVDSALRAASESHGAEYVSTLRWDLEFLADNLHLTPAGHARFAELISAEIGKGEAPSMPAS